MGRHVCDDAHIDTARGVRGGVGLHSHEQVAPERFLHPAKRKVSSGATPDLHDPLASGRRTNQRKAQLFMTGILLFASVQNCRALPILHELTFMFSACHQ